MATDNCWVQFWEHDDYEKGTLKFDGPKDVPDMDDYELQNPDGRDKGLDDQVDSLKTGTRGWLELYKGKNYTDDVLRVEANKQLPELDDYGFGDNTNSFRLYDQRPVSWPVSDPDTPGDCWVRFYGGNRFDTLPYRLDGPGTGDYVALYPDNGAPRSLTTGPKTWVELYPQSNQAGAAVRIGPNALVTNYQSAYDVTSFASIVIYDSQPRGWLDTLTKPNAQSIAMAIEAEGVNQTIEALIAGLVGTTPVVGSAIAGIINAFWPQPSEQEAVWDALQVYMQALVAELLNAELINGMKDALQVLYTDLVAYQAVPYGDPDKGLKFNTLIQNVTRDREHYIDDDNPQDTLTYMVSLGTIALLVFREQALFYEDIYGAPPSNPQLYVDEFLGNLEDYTETLRTATDNALAWREQQISLEPASGGYVVVDAKTGYRSPTYNSSTSGQDAQAAYTEYVMFEFSRQIEATVHPATLWSCLTPGSTDTVTEETVRVQSLLVSQRGDGTAFSDDPSAPVTGVLLRSGTLIDAIQMIYGAAPGPLHGANSGSPEQWNLDEGEGIVAVFGGAGLQLDQLMFRTDKGREFGAGGSGGEFFAMLAPGGYNAVLESIQGLQSSTALQAFQATWVYQRYVKSSG